MKYKILCVILLIISIIFLFTALFLFKNISFPFLGNAIVLIGIILIIWLNTKTFK